MRYKVGNRIKIKNLGGSYNGHQRMAEKLELKNWAKYYDDFPLPVKGKIMRIVKEGMQIFMSVRLDNGYDIILSGNGQYYCYIDIIKQFELPKELFTL